MFLISGSLAFDEIGEFDGRFAKQFQNSSKISAAFVLQKSRREFGGTAGNIAFSLAQLGEKEIFLKATAGDDFENYEKHLRKFGISTEFVEIFKTEKTAQCQIFNDAEKNQILFF